MKPIILTLSLCVIMASGCASRGPIGSFAGPLPEQDAVAAIADDGVSFLAEYYPPGHTMFRLLPAKVAENGFAAAFENSLRAKGFALAAPDASYAITLAYTLDMLDTKTAWYLRLRATGGKVVRDMGRSYDVQGQPEAGQSLIVSEVFRFSAGEAVDTAKEKAANAYDATRDFLKQ